MVKRLILTSFTIFVFHMNQSAATYCNVTINLPDNVKNIVQTTVAEYLNNDLDDKERKCKTNCNKNRKCINACADRFFEYGERYKNLKVKGKSLDITQKSGEEILTVKDGQFPFHMTLCYDQQSQYYQCEIISDTEDLKQTYAAELQKMTFTMDDIDIFGKYLVARLSPEKILVEGEEMSDNLHVSLISSDDPKVLRDLKKRITQKLELNSEPITFSVPQGKVSCR